MHSKEVYKLLYVKGDIWTLRVCEIYIIALQKKYEMKNELHLHMNGMDQIYLPSDLVLNTTTGRKKKKGDSY